MRPEPTKAVGSYSGSSFYWALKLLPQHKRAAMFAIYAFCREVDDIADGDDRPTDKMEQLEHYRAAVNALYGGGQVDVPSVAALRDVVADYAIRSEDLIAVIDGMETDAFDTVRLDDEAAFDQYLDRVACAVGRLSDRVFGLEGEDAELLAHHLGRALQITNILRDLAEDAERGRLYLPGDLLARHGVAGDTPQAVLAHSKLESALDELATRAEGCFRRAEGAIERLNTPSTKPARLMMAVYWRILERLRKRGLARIDQTVRLNKWAKLWLALRYGVFG